MTVTINGNGTITPKTVVQPAGSVLQVVSRVQNSAKSTGTSGSFVNVSDVYGTITPASSSSKILILINGTVSSAAGISCGFRLNRTISSTTIQVGGAADTNIQSGLQNLYTGSENHLIAMNYHFLDSPSTTSATTYKLQVNSNSGYYINRSQTTGGATTVQRPQSVSGITLMEVLA